MPPNAYVLLAVTVGAVKAALALWLTITAFLSLRVRRTDPNSAEGAEALVSALSLPVLALTLAGLLLEYLILQRWQTELPGAMCLYGVVNFGKGQKGVVGWLPGLFEASVWLNTAALFLTACWATGAAVERASAVQSRRSPALLLAMCLGLTAMAAASTDVGFLSTPRALSNSTTGCCVVTSAIGSEEAPTMVSPEMQRGGWIGFLAVNLVLIACLLGFQGDLGAASQKGTVKGVALAMLVVVSAAVTLPFVKQVLSTQLLGLPYHQCVYDLLQRVPEVAIALGLYFAGIVALGSALVVRLLYRGPLTSKADGRITKMLQFSTHALLGCLVMVGMTAALGWK